MKRLLGVSAPVLVLLGLVAWLMGGRPMLFVLLVCWGLAACAALAAISWRMGERRGKCLRRCLAALLCAGIAAFGALEGVVLMGAHTVIDHEPQAMVILGAKLWDAEPSPVLQARLDTALDYLEAHPDLTVVVSGGQADGEVMSEAACMADYLAERGVPKTQILLEEQARNTLQNISFSKDVLETAGLQADRLLVVSNGAHLARARMLGRRCGAEVSVLAAPTPGPLVYRIYFNCREAAALAKSWLFDREVPHA